MDGEKVKNARMEENLTQAELAKITGLSRVAIANIERGATKDVKASTMIAIADALHRKVNELFL